MDSIPSLQRYMLHLQRTSEWLVRSIGKGHGGSSAYFSPVTGWARSYPETTGYIIPTLLKIKDYVPDSDHRALAVDLGDWLLRIQMEDGAWPGGLYPPRGGSRASVFNTGQILMGMCALYWSMREKRWLNAAARGAAWLASGVTTDGQWGGTDYRSHLMPSYYTHVAWPMLEVWHLTAADEIRSAAEKVLAAVLSRRLESGTFHGWGFNDGQFAFTHTIAYTLWGFLESARLTENWSAYGEPCVEAMEILLRRAELNGGRLSGAYTTSWKGDSTYSCLTGDVQIALCLLRWEERENDLRIVNAAAKLVDYVCSKQHLHALLPGVRGGVPGSEPLWGKYMTLRYPNWSAKYHCDALMALISRLRVMLESEQCAS